MNVIEKIFVSRDQVQILRFFLFHPNDDFSLLDLKKRAGLRRLHSSAGLNTLLKMGCLLSEKKEGAKLPVYRMNTSWELFPELRSLFVKAQLLVEHDLVRSLERAGQIKLLILTGLFVGQQTDVTDILIVGSVKHSKVSRILRAFERDFDQEVRYTILSNSEFKYRKNVGDRFLYSILENRHLVVIDTVERPVKTKPKPRVKSSHKKQSKTRSPKRAVKRKKRV